MKDLFLRVMATCAAVSVFGGGAYVAYSGVTSINEATIKAVLSSQMATASVDQQSGYSSGVEIPKLTSDVDTVLQGIKKLMKAK